MKIKYWSVSSMPPKFPVGATILWWMFLDKIQAREGWYWAVGTLLVLITISELVRMIIGDKVEL